MISINHCISKISNTKVSWVCLNLAMLGTVSLIAIYGYCFPSQSQFFDFTTLMITLCASLILAAPMFTKQATTFMLGSVFSLMSVIFIYPRLLFLQFYPDAIPMPFSVVLSLLQFNKALGYMVLGLAAILLGTYIFDLVTTRLYKATENSFGGASNLVVVSNTATFSLFVTIALTTSLIFGFNIYSANESVRQNWMLGLLAVLFTTSTSALISIARILDAREGISYRRLCLLFIVLVYLLSSTISGSRAGPLVILIIFFSCSLLLQGNFRIKVRDYLFFFALLFSASFIAFQWGTEARNALMRTHNPAQVLAQATAELQEAIELQKERSASSGSIKTSLRLSLAEKKFLYRYFSPFDIAIVGLTLPVETKLSQKIMTTEYMFKSAINIIVPGVIFRDAQLNSSLAWPFIFKLRDEKNLQLKYYYETFPWSIWATCALMYGPGLGLLAMFIIGLLIGILNLGFSATRSGLAIKACFVYTLASLLFMGGMDDYIVFVISSMNSVLLFIFANEFCIRPLIENLSRND